MPEIRYIQTVEGLNASRSEIESSSSLGCDIETLNDDLNVKAFDPFTSRIRTLQISPNREKTFVFDIEKLNGRRDEFNFVRGIFADRRVTKMFHNAKFDLRFLRLHFDATEFESIFDTMLASTIINSGEDKVRVSLEECVKRLCFRQLDKAEQKSHFNGELSESQIKYAGIDAWILHDLREEEIKWLRALDLIRCANIEFEAVPTVAHIENTGMFLDGEMWLKHALKIVKDRDDAKAEISEFIKDVCNVSLFGDIDINFESNDEVAAAFRRKGVEVPEGTISWKLKPYLKKAPILQRWLDLRSAQTKLKTFGPQYIEHIHPVTSRIHAQFKQIGAPTGRFSCGDPNLQQIPVDPEYRGCYKPQSKNRRFVIADYSMIELRLLAEFSRDEILIKAFNDKIDLHSLTGSMVFGKALDSCGKGTKERKLGKDLNFGTVYDISAQRFALNTGQTDKEAERQLKAFFEKYKGLDIYLKDAAQQAITQREARTWSGRSHILNFNEKDKGEVGTAGRNGRNTPIQGTGADILKIAIRETEKRLIPFGDAEIVNIIHDEIVVECDERDAEAVKDVLVERMEFAGQCVMQFVPCVVDAEIKSDWIKD